MVGQPGRYRRNGLARFNPHLMGAPKSAQKLRSGQIVVIGLQRLSVQDLAALTHLGFKKGFQQSHALGTPHGHHQTAMDQIDPGGPGHLNPNVARALGPGPHVAAFLPGNSDETEISNRSPVGLGIAVNDHDPLATPRRREGAGQTNNARTHNSKIIGSGHGHSFQTAAGKRQLGFDSYVAVFNAEL